MKFILSTLLLLIYSTSYADQLRVAVIDTGYNGMFATPQLRSQLCKDGHYDVTLDQPVLGFDLIGHGTHVANLLFETAGVDDSCLLVYKIIDPFIPSPEDAIYRALVQAYKASANVINISASTNKFSAKEQRALQILTKKGVQIFLSAGNESDNLNDVCKTYPSCYRNLNSNFHIVGALDNAGLVEAYSNRGLKVDIYEYGIIEGVGRGTSFASPRAAGNFIREKYGKK